MITIVDYGMGNLRSVQKGFERVGHAAAITSDPDEIHKATKLVLPGVGAFEDAIGELHRLHLVGPILDIINEGKPFLGICLGLQLLFETSYENGTHRGLGVLPGDVVKFEIPRDYSVPHMGWNELEIRRRPPFLEGIPDRAYVYFVHSYYVVPHDTAIVATETDYGVRFCSTVWRDNVIACQFHPEKSQTDGLRMLKNFAEIA